MEVKFKNGDSVAIPEGCKAAVKDNVVIFEAIEPKFKKGDFVYGEHLGYDQKFVFIFDREKDSGSSFDKAILFIDDERILYDGVVGHDSVRHATESEKQQLIAKLRENGKDWDAKKCEIVDYRWRAKNGCEYWTIKGGITGSVKECYDDFDNKSYESGNYFKTEDIAEKAAEKVKELLLTLKHS